MVILTLTTMPPKLPLERSLRLDFLVGIVNLFRVANGIMLGRVIQSLCNLGYCQLRLHGEPSSNHLCMDLPRERIPSKSMRSSSDN